MELRHGSGSQLSVISRTLKLPEPLARRFGTFPVISIDALVTQHFREM